MKNEPRVFLHASELLTGEGVAKKRGRRVQEEDLGRIEDGALVVSESKGGRPGKVLWVGPTRDLPKRYLKWKAKNLKNRQALVPGLVDCHTHLVFAGDRSEEFALRCGGTTYEEIAKRGGGILSTVRATRGATEAELERLATTRVKEAWSFGVRTLEVKSGYGLDFDTELKCLRVVKRLRKRFPEVEFQSTFLGAHAFPKDRTREEYFRELCEKMLPEVARGKWAEACDVFVDAGYFTLQEAEELLVLARELGLKTKIHADELTETGSSSLAARLGCLSADHLLKISNSGIQALARSETVAVLLPGTAFYLKAAHAPARKLLDSGARVALSTDFNPGTCMTLNLPFIMSLSALYLGMTRAEIFAAVTYNAAAALGFQDRLGTLTVGAEARYWAMPFARFEEAYYRLAWGAAT